MTSVPAIDDFDRDLLAFIEPEAPWHRICAVLHYSFPEPQELIDRIWRLRGAGLLVIEPAAAASSEATPVALLADAEAHDWHFETTVRPGGPLWTLRLTARGAEAARARGEAEGRERVRVRSERPEDRVAVRRVNREAFEDETEARLVDLLRGEAEPLVSLVAERRGEVVGHILLTPVEVEESPAGSLVMGLGPMAVLPAWQGQGVGGELIRSGIEACRRLGASAVVVLGHRDYYPRFGFQPAASSSLRYREGEVQEHFMVRELVAGALETLAGEVRYLSPFDQVR
jgi:putative acetyltransferase